MDEQYIYLGCQLDTHFFLHAIANPAFEKTISDQIYNVMINESRIVDANKNVIIYEFNILDGSVYLTAIQHATKEPTTFDESNIKDFLTTLISAERTDMYVIRYNYQKGCYESFEVDGNLIGSSSMLVPDDTPPIGEIRYIMITKPID